MPTSARDHDRITGLEQRVARLEAAATGELDDQGDEPDDPATMQRRYTRAQLDDIAAGYGMDTTGLRTKREVAETIAGVR